jgi:hypothetical protein
MGGEECTDLSMLRVKFCKVKWRCSCNVVKSIDRVKVHAYIEELEPLV